MKFKGLRRQMKANRQAGPYPEGSDLLINNIKYIIKAMKNHQEFCMENDNVKAFLQVLSLLK